MSGKPVVIEAIVGDFNTYAEACSHYVVMGGGHQAEQKKYDNLALYLDGVLSASDILSTLKLGSRFRLEQLDRIKAVVVILSENDTLRTLYLQTILSATDNDLIAALEEAKPKLIPLQERLRRG